MTIHDTNVIPSILKVRSIGHMSQPLVQSSCSPENCDLLQGVGQHFDLSCGWWAPPSHLYHPRWRRDGTLRRSSDRRRRSGIKYSRRADLLCEDGLREDSHTVFKNGGGIPRPPLLFSFATLGVLSQADIFCAEVLRLDGSIALDLIDSIVLSRIRQAEPRKKWLTLDWPRSAGHWSLMPSELSNVLKSDGYV